MAVRFRFHDSLYRSAETVVCPQSIQGPLFWILVARNELEKLNISDLRTRSQASDRTIEFQERMGTSQDQQILW